MATTTAPWTPQILARLGQMILLLASPHDGEKLAACAAILRTLAAAGLDLHALTDFLRRAAAPPDPPPREAEAPQAMAAWCLRVGAAMLTAK